MVLSGQLLEPYTGRQVTFRKAEASKLQIDHIYPLARAWDLGAANWSIQRRVDFANDVADNLLAVDGSANTSKSDQGQGEWLPINKTFRCTYVLRYLHVANKYDLAITRADQQSAKTIGRSHPTARNSDMWLSNPLTIMLNRLADQWAKLATSLQSARARCWFTTAGLWAPRRQSCICRDGDPSAICRSPGPPQ